MDVRTRKFALLTLPALALAASTQIIQTGGIPIIAGALAQSSCQFEVIGTTVPPTSGNPVVIDDISGTVISANFFNGGAIDSPYFDGLETVSVCVSQPDSNGKRTAQITTDVGLDNDFIIKGYPEFVVGSKFGNIFETSHRYYSNAGLLEEDKWPVVATGLDQQGFPFEFANLEYISNKRDVGLPAFTTNLPNITVTLDVDETNVVGAERDVMLESWFFDTSKNANIIGNNIATNGPVANTLNNIVGVGNKHYPQLDNTLLEMMVHIGPLSPHDISGSKNNPGQNQLTEIYSGLDFDLDGIDDHFDVDSHEYINSNNPLDPKPGIYSSGVDQNGDGIDDADLLPIIIGDFAYSIWYGETFLSPVVIFSRETNSTLTNDFDPTTADMNLTDEGEISLPWNEFLDYTLFDVETKLQNLGVAWVTGADNPFPAMRANGGAIGGVEFGVEPQTNNPADEPYNLTINKFTVEVNGKTGGLTSFDDLSQDDQPPLASISVPTGNVQEGNVRLAGDASDIGPAGIGTIRIAIWSVDDSAWFNFQTRSTIGAVGNGSIVPDITNEGWEYNTSLPLGTYSLLVKAWDTAGNSTDWETRRFTVTSNDNQGPVLTFTSPSGTIVGSTATLSGSAIDVGTAGLDVVRIALWSANDNTWYNFQLGAIGAASGNGSTVTATDSSGNWSHTLTLSPGNYALRAKAWDNAGNSTAWETRQFTITTNDNQAPSLAITGPAANQPNSNLTLSGTASDIGNAGLDVVRIALWSATDRTWFNFQTGTIGGTNGNGSINPNIGSNGNWQYSVSLPSGTYALRAKAWDKANNSTTWLTRHFTIVANDDQPPLLNFTDPSSSLTAGNITLAGTATDVGSTGLATVRIALWSNTYGDWVNFQSGQIGGVTGNGSVVPTINASGSWHKAITLQPGTYTLRAKAWDKADNSSFWENRTFIVN